MEMNEGWLEPLLALVAEDRTTIANPIMDYITNIGMQFMSVGSTHTFGMFGWSFVFNWLVLS